MCLPHNEWGYLLCKVKGLNGYLRKELGNNLGLTESDNAWIRDRLVEGQLLADLIECPDFRRGCRDWINSVNDELELIHERPSSRLL